MDDLAIYRYVQRLTSIGVVKDAMKFMKNTLIGLFQTHAGLKIKHFSPGILYSHLITKPSQATPGLALPEHLKALELHIRFYDTADQHMSGLQNTLSKMLCLERLVLEIGPHRTHTRCDFLEGFRPSLPKLEHLEICGGHIAGYYLPSLLIQYIGCLRSLRLDMVSLIGQPQGQQSSSWLQMLSIFLSEDWSLAKVALFVLSSR